MQTYDLERLRQYIINRNYDPQQIAFEDNFALFENISDINFAAVPTRVNMAVFGLCLQGEQDIIIDTQLMHLQNNSYFVVLPNQVVTIKSEQNKNLSGIFICINQSVYNELIQRMQEMLPLFLHIKQHPTATLDEKDVKWIANYHKQIIYEIQQKDNIFHRETAKAIMTALLYKICNIYSNELIDKSPQKNRQEEIFTTFLQQVSRHFKQNREVSYYAGLLCITPKYLSTIIKRVSGQSANEWIQSYVVQEAKLQLKTTHKTIQEIAIYLNFPSQSFFGKYFKHLVGYSPQQYRKLPSHE